MTLTEWIEALPQETMLVVTSGTMRRYDRYLADAIIERDGDVWRVVKNRYGDVGIELTTR